MGEILIKINKNNWTVTIEGVGYRSNECLPDIKKVLKELNAVTLRRVIKNHETLKKELVEE